MKTSQPIPAKVSQDGKNAKPVNTYNKEFCENRQVSCLSSNICECKNADDFETNYPERPLTQPMPPGSEIMVEGDTVWYVREPIGYRDLVIEPEAVNDCFVWDGTNSDLEDLKSKFKHLEFYQAYQPILTNQQGEGEKEQPTEQQIGTPVNLGVANGIKPCPLCNGVEGEDVFLGYQEPRYMITCVPCSLRIIDDRKDKVQAKWNLRNGKGFWDNMPASQPTADQSASVETVELAANIDHPPYCICAKCLDKVDALNLTNTEIPKDSKIDGLFRLIGDAQNEHIGLLVLVNKNHNKESLEGFYDYQCIADANEALNELSNIFAQYQQAKDLQQVVELIEGEIGALTVDKLDISPEDHFGYSIAINSKIDALTDILTQIKNLK